jgi:hypothetical protein
MLNVSENPEVRLFSQSRGTSAAKIRDKNKQHPGPIMPKESDHLKLVNKDYTGGEIAASIFTLGMYTIIRDCLGFKRKPDSLGLNILKVSAITLGNLITGGLAGVGYLAFRLYKEAVKENTQEGEGQQVDMKPK